MADRPYGGPMRRNAVPAAMAPWQCLACGAKHVGDMAKGCPSCGVGTPQPAVKPTTEIALEKLLEKVVTPEAMHATPGEFWLMLPGLTRAARLTVASALAHYGSHGSPTDNELTRVFLTTWGRRIYEQEAAAMDAEEAAAREAQKSTGTAGTQERRYDAADDFGGRSGFSPSFRDD